MAYVFLFDGSIINTNMGPSLTFIPNDIVDERLHSSNDVLRTSSSRGCKRFGLFEFLGEIISFLGHDHFAFGF